MIPAFSGADPAMLVPTLVIIALLLAVSAFFSGAETALSVQGEYLLSEETPIAVFAGYTYSDLSNAGGHVSTFLMGLRFYFNTDGFSSLTERQRSGTVGTIGNFGAVGLNL